jgi:hypothetical protein
VKDFLGQEVKVGDKVVCLEKGYNNLVKATVVKITAQNIKVTWPGMPNERDVLRHRNQFVKVADESL